MLRDLRFAIRMLAKHPTFALVAVLTLGLGIGAVTAIFSVVSAVVLKPLPYPEPERLVRFYSQFKGMFDKFWISPPEYFELRRDAGSLGSIGAFQPGSAAIAGRDRPLRVDAASVTASLLPTIGVHPHLGRFFTDTEDREGDPQVVMLGYGLWQRAFAGDPEIVGKTVLVDAIPVVVTGIMPRGFDFPGDGVEMWLPIGLDPGSQARGNHRLSVVGRLRPEATVAQAKAELATLVTTWSQASIHHKINPNTHPMIVFGLKEETVGGVKWALWLLQGAVIFVLLIACANISNLLLARAEARSREIAIRNALGADRGRLIRQFLTESLLLGLFGGVVGILFAIWGLDVTLGLMPEGAPRAGEIRIDWVVLAFAVGCTLATSLLFGLAPILHTRVQDLHGSLKEGQRSATSPRQRFRRALVVSEVALAVVLVIGCGLMIRSFSRLSQVDVGLRPDHLITMEVELPEKAYPDDAQVLAYWLRVKEKVDAVPGVAKASMMYGLPPNRRINANDLGLPGRTQKEGDPPLNVDFWQTVGDDYFETMGIKVVAGRVFGPGDAAGAQPVVVINEAFARRFFPGEDPVGKLVQVRPWEKELPPQTVIGVVGDVKQQGIEAPTGTEVYTSLRQSKEIFGETPRFLRVVARTEIEPAAAMATVRGVVSGLDATLPVANTRTMEAVLYEAVAKPRFLTFLFAVFAGLALVLAAVGIYGVMSYSVAQRTRELGIRMALGARAAGVRALVLREGMFLAGLGVLIGLAGAAALNLALGRALAGLLFQVPAIDPLTFAFVTLVVVVVAGVACFLPAARATRVDPMIALRQE
jgi:putative ABC transport system permease protein